MDVAQRLVSAASALVPTFFQAPTDSPLNAMTEIPTVYAL
jgi:hypothetical protein